MKWKENTINALISRFGLTKIFSWIILAGIIFIAFLSYITSSQITENILTKNEIEINLNLSHSLGKTISTEYFSFLIFRKNFLPLHQTTDPTFSRLDHFIQSQIKDSHLVKVRIYNPSGVLIYSSSGEEIGKRSLDSSLFINALQKGYYSNVSGWNALGKNLFSSTILFTGIPLFGIDKTKNILGILEISTDISSAQNEAFEISVQWVATLVVLSFILYLFLFIFVSKADKIIHEINQTRYNAQEEKIRYLAHFDTLTDLPNRDFFFQTLQMKMAEAEANKTTISLILIGIDRFKMLNETLGSDTGDWLLTQIARRLKDTVHSSQFISRIAGDQFAVILDNQDLDVLATTVLELQVGIFEDPFTILGKEILLTAGIGVAYYPGLFSDSQELIQAAEKALLRAKQLGLNHFVVYSDAIDDFAKEKFQTEILLKQALHQNEFRLYYQPKINTITRKVTGMEALIRWVHPQKGILGPEHFISILEESGLIVPVGEWILKEACTQCQKWHEEGFKTLKVAINLSFKQFHSGYLLEAIQYAITESGISPFCMELELTESVLADDSENAVLILKELKKLGVTISIDDFGTGYSSLSYLTHFPIDQIKIDKSFINDVSNNREKATLTKSIIAMAQNLNLGVIAEGVEKADQMEFVSVHGCNEVQGFLYSQPTPAEEFIALVERINSM